MWSKNKDKERGMKNRYFLVVILLVIMTTVFISLAYSQDKFKLKLGAKGKLCLNCHVAFTDILKKSFVHTPVKAGDCSACHNPHASTHGKMLSGSVGDVCFKCHNTLISEKSLSVHKVVLEGNCVLCHDPHASDNRFNLLKAGNELCAGCHKDVTEGVKSAKFKHPPVDKGCVNCHNPHASTKAAFLLKDGMPSLCLQCHKADKPSFMSQHMNYPVGRANCGTCHNPHGSDRGGILFNNVHKPVSNKMCNQCHEEPTSQNPFKTKRVGFELCKGCHSNMINDMFNKNRIHWPVLSKSGCLSCHNPHATTQNALLKAPMLSLCGSCHLETLKRQERSQTKHPPIQEGNCTACHTAHSDDNPFLFNNANVIDLCGTCHEWQKHSSHPIGEKFPDPRNKNLIVQCLSCHRSHGTENKYFIHFPTISELCTQCHVQFRR
jgi:predicted CXXCH cytochrome family protein